MRAYLSENWNQILDGLLFGLGILAIYLGAVLDRRDHPLAWRCGQQGTDDPRPLRTGWFDYVRGDDRNTINVTLNIVVDDHLEFDTIVSDRRIWTVWPNQYRDLPDPARREADHDRHPVIMFPPPPVSTQAPQHRRAITDMLASVTVTENGKSQRVAWSARTTIARPTRR